MRYRADSAARDIGQAAPTRGGSYTLVQFHDEFYMQYSMEGMTEADLNNRIFFFKQEVMAPARLAGGILLVAETMDQVKEHRNAWLYNPGQRRVRRAPNVAYDNPGTAADAMRTSDQFDMYNGAIDRYDWKLVGKKEIYVPYNSYKLQDPSVKFKDILTPLHINQDLVRYELHRVWVVDATLKEGARHIYKRRTFYLDEDSWQIVVVDCLRQARPAVAGVRGARHDLLQRAVPLDLARGPHRSPGGPLSGHRSQQREPAVRVRHQTLARGLHPGRAAPRGQALGSIDRTAGGPEAARPFLRPHRSRRTNDGHQPIGH